MVMFSIHKPCPTCWRSIQFFETECEPCRLERTPVPQVTARKRKSAKPLATNGEE